jgi:hypothetical protein
MYELFLKVTTIFNYSLVKNVHVFTTFKNYVYKVIYIKQNKLEIIVRHLFKFVLFKIN